VGRQKAKDSMASECKFWRIEASIEADMTEAFGYVPELAQEVLNPEEPCGECAACRADADACPGCGCEPGDGVTASCNDPAGCGYFKAQAPARESVAWVHGAVERAEAQAAAGDDKAAERLAMARRSSPPTMDELRRLLGR